MHKALAALILLAGCCEAGDRNRSRAEPDSISGKREPSRLTSLTGRFESGRPPAINQLCIVESGKSARFGLVSQGAGNQSCSGSGNVFRRGERLHFAMSGDSPCAFDAEISGKTIIFPHAVPASCAYYCGARANLRNLRLAQVGASRAQAMKAQDLVGEPLCSVAESESARI